MVDQAGRIYCKDHMLHGLGETWWVGEAENATRVSFRERNIMGMVSRICWITEQNALHCFEDLGTSPEVKAIDVAVGEWHECIISVGGGVLCRGSNEFRELGVADPSWDDRETDKFGEVALSKRRSAAITAGARHTCVLTVEGQVTCWGANALRQCQGTASPSAPPAKPVGVGVVTEIHSSQDHTCARRSATEVVCWGDSADGKLGVDPSDRRCHGLDCPPVVVVLPTTP